jgi:cell division protein FtsL
MRAKNKEAARSGLWLVNLLLLLLVVGSALGVVYSSYQSRQLFNAVQQQYRGAMRLDEEWGRLLLEKSTWAAPSRIERLASTRLGMIAPDPATVIVVKQ